jgi:hypothetical protein
MPPLFRRTFGSAADDRVARLKKFYEITGQKEVLRKATDYTKRGRNFGQPR